MSLVLAAWLKLSYALRQNTRALSQCVWRVAFGVAQKRNAESWRDLQLLTDFHGMTNLT